MPGPSRYTLSARCYDAVSAEWPVYRVGRVAAIHALRLRPGLRVLDLGCGTGLNFPLLQRRVGPPGEVVGVDLNPHMLAQARRRAQSQQWCNVELVADDMRTVQDLGGFDVVIATYALSLVPDWERAWATALAACRPGGQLAVVDMQRPQGRARLLTPLARLACALGGADIDAHPWTALERDCGDVIATGLRGGHVQVRVGNRL